MNVLTSIKSNILVDGSGHARIADFYLATVTYDLDWIQTASEGRYRIAAWTAPEILNFEGSYSKEADIFSFAMVMVEVRHRRFFRRGFTDHRL